MSSFQISTHCHPRVSHDLTLWPPQGNNSGSATGRSHGLKPQLSPPCRCLHGWLLGEGSCAELTKLPAALCYLWAGSSRSVSAGASLILTLPSSSYVRLHTPQLVSSCSRWLVFQERVHQLSQLQTGMVPAPTATHFKAKALAANNKMSSGWNLRFSVGVGGAWRLHLRLLFPCQCQLPVFAISGAGSLMTSGTRR